ncbi:MAG: hypothetical protein WD688_25670 [Candidatus Binatia bacterium]
MQQQCGALFADPALHPISSKVALGHPDDHRPAMLTDTEYASEDEKPVIINWVKKRDQCHQIAGLVRAMLRSQIIPVLENFKNVTDSLIAELYFGHISYGELANKRIITFHDVKMAEAIIEHHLLLFQNPQAESESRQLANEAIANWKTLMHPNALQQMRAHMMTLTTGAKPTNTMNDR